MARRKRRRRKASIPLAVVFGLGAGLYSPIRQVMEGRPEKALATGIANFTGYSVESNDFKIERLQHGLVPLLLGVAVHKGASMLGVNRALAQAGVPLIRI